MEGTQLLEEALDALNSDSYVFLDDKDIGPRLIDLLTQRARLDAEIARMLGAFDLRGAFRTDGSRSAAAWLTAHTHMFRPEAYSWVRLAKRLRFMPATKKALTAGDITREHALRLAKLAFSPRRPVRDAFPAAEATLIEEGKDLLFADFERVLRYWQDLVDPDGSETAAADDFDARHLHASELLRGCVRIDGTMDPVGGAIFLTELTRIERELFDNDWTLAKAEHGDDVTAEQLSRSPAQRRADALTEMARRSAEHEPRTDADGEVRPLFSVHIGPDVVTRMCELASGTVIAPNLLVPHLGEADIERIIYGPEKRVIELSKRDRFFRGGLRRAMQLRDRWCATDGCHELAEDCEVDHIKPTSQGGETTQEKSWASK